MESELVNPNPIWEKFTCDKCYRYLSVNPIRVYPNKSMRCGRCSKHDTDGMIASFGGIANQFLFKCVNRFDGCRKLLPNNLVEEHEKNCFSKKYFCPLCPEKSLELPTYLLITHFKEEHKHNILENPWIFVDLGDSCDVNKMLLYNIDDHLFFVTFQFNMKDCSFFLGALYVGSAERARKIKQKFSLLSNDIDLELKTKCKSCNYFGSSSPEGFSVKRSEYQSNKFIILIELDLKGVELFKMPFSDRSNMVDSSYTGKLQKIYLSLGFLNSNPIYSIDTSGTALVITENDSDMIVTFQCCVCFVKLCGSEINTLESGRKSFCTFCVEYYKTKDSNAQMKKFSVPQELENNLKFICKWNCNGLIPYGASKIKHEEEFCTFQPTKVCPVESCVFEGNSYDLQNHFGTNHELANLYLNSTTTVITINMPNTPSTQPQHDPYTGRQRVPVPVPESKTLWYFLMDNTFVMLKELNKNDGRIFLIENCTDVNANDQLQPAVIVFDQKYVDTFKHSFLYKGNGSFSVNVILEKVRP